MKRGIVVSGVFIALAAAGCQKRVLRTRLNLTSERVTGWA